MAEERFDPLAIQDVDDEIFTEQSNITERGLIFQLEATVWIL